MHGFYAITHSQPTKKACMCDWQQQCYLKTTVFAGMQSVTRLHAIQSFGLAISHDTTLVEFGICGAVDWLHTID